jgi:hypothetical protein
MYAIFFIFRNDFLLFLCDIDEEASRRLENIFCFLSKGILLLIFLVPFSQFSLSINQSIHHIIIIIADIVGGTQLAVHVRAYVIIISRSSPSLTHRRFAFI